MTPDDPRHGQNKGYVAGCRDFCCRRAHMIEMKRYRMGPKRKVPAIGAQRRIQALVAIGWPTSQLCARLGRDRNYLLKVLHVDTIQEPTHVAVARLYDELSMIAPVDGPDTNSAHKRARLMAQRRGWAPPLAWDDPDSDPAPNYGGTDPDVDPVVVMRLLEGDRIPATTAERHAAMAQWVEQGGSQAELCRWHGWKEGRYGRLTLVEGGAA